MRFETSKTEAILFSRRRKHRRCKTGIRVGDQTVHFAPEATRWLEIWLNSTLTLAENRRRRIGKTRQEEARPRRIVNRYGAPPAAARNLQLAIIQGTMLYASEFRGTAVRVSRGSTRGSSTGWAEPHSAPFGQPPLASSRLRAA